MLTEEITLRLVKEIKRFLLEDALALSRSSDEQLMVRIKEIIELISRRSAGTANSLLRRCILANRHRSSRKCTW